MATYRVIKNKETRQGITIDGWSVKTTTNGAVTSVGRVYRTQREAQAEADRLEALEELRR